MFIKKEEIQYFSERSQIKNVINYELLNLLHILKGAFWPRFTLVRHLRLVCMRPYSNMTKTVALKSYTSPIARYLQIFLH